MGQDDKRTISDWDVGESETVVIEDCGSYYRHIFRPRKKVESRIVEPKQLGDGNGNL